MMKRYFFNLVASLAVGGTVMISVPLAQAGGKGGFSMGGLGNGNSMRSSMNSGKSMSMSRANISNSLGSQSIVSRSMGTKVATHGVNRNLTTTKANLHKFGGQHVTKHNLGIGTIANHGKLTGLNGKINGTKFDHGKFNGGLHGKLTGNGTFQKLPHGNFPGKFDGKLDGNFGKLPKFPGHKPGDIVKPHFPKPPICPPGLPPYQPCPPVCGPSWGGWGGWCGWLPGFGSWGGNCGTVVCPPSGGVTVIETVAQQPVVQTVALQPQVANIDLELLNLQLIDAGDAARKLGPRYRVTYRNAGTLAAGNFQVLLMASRDGSVQGDNPVATAEVIGVNAGETSQVDVRLPASAQAADMAALIVAVDRAMQVEDVNRDNNAAIVDRAKLQVAAN